MTSRLRLTRIDRLWFTRHAQSTGNVARDRAEAAGDPVIEIAERDADVALSTQGTHQAAALAGWAADLPERPTAVVCSPYRRTRDTARAVADALQIPIAADERLRDRELGILDRLTRAGVAERFPAEHARKRHLGQFYYRPPGGESWADMTLRLRDVLRDLDGDYAGERLMVITHEVLILLARYLLEGWSEAELLRVRDGSIVPNCSTTTWGRSDGALALRAFNQNVLPEGSPA